MSSRGSFSTEASRRRRTLLVLLVVLGLTVASGAVAPGAGAAPAPRTAIWVGSPVTSTWPDSRGCPASSTQSAGCSRPEWHHTFNYGDPFRGDVGWDLQRPPVGRAVKLYAAPQNTRFNAQVTARVLRVVPACGAKAGETSAQRIGRGGYAVVVELRHGSTPVGTVKYVHINPSVRAGQVISRWGSTIGTVGSYRSNSCWTGVHVHMELMNYSRYACFNRSWRPGQQTQPSNFVGYIGGAFASAPRRGCP